MLQQILIQSSVLFDFNEFARQLGVKNLVLSITPDDVPNAWGFYWEGHSTTLFTIEKDEDGYVVSMDCMASYDDYRLFPYLVDTLHSYLCDVAYTSEDGKSAFHTFDEEWTEYCIGEEVAYIKCLLSIGQKYYFSLPLSEGFPYITETLLNGLGVSMHSSTPRIYGYVQYALRNGLISQDEECDVEQELDMEVDVPQHHSIGIVKSWQTDGAETTESYAKEDVELLLTIRNRYKDDNFNIPGVVLNDVGTIFEHGIGVEKDIPEAIKWYEEAIKRGDHYFAPTNLGDIYRRGLLDGKRNAKLAVEAYHKSEDPYAWYRIGQSIEEGWIEDPNIEKAMFWYKKAAAVGHHLAIDRLNNKPLCQL